eukprot:scaffold317021_cov31-Tisochrysis_lutea.AAC.1
MVLEWCVDNISYYQHAQDRSGGIMAGSSVHSISHMAKGDGRVVRLPRKSLDVASSKGAVRAVSIPIAQSR